MELVCLLHVGLLRIRRPFSACSCAYTPPTPPPRLFWQNHAFMDTFRSGVYCRYRGEGGGVVFVAIPLHNARAEVGVVDSTSPYTAARIYYTRLSFLAATCCCSSFCFTFCSRRCLDRSACSFCSMRRRCLFFVASSFASVGMNGAGGWFHRDPLSFAVTALVTGVGLCQVQRYVMVLMFIAPHLCLHCGARSCVD